MIKGRHTWVREGLENDKDTALGEGKTKARDRRHENEGSAERRKGKVNML